MIRKRKPGTHSFTDKWENRKVARVVAMALAGKSSVQIADELGDGTTPATIRRMLAQWGVALAAEPFCKVPLTNRCRAFLGWRAARRGLSAEEYARQIIDAVVSEDLYETVMRLAGKRKSTP